MGTERTDGPVCFFVWKINLIFKLLQGSRVSLDLRRYIVSWREYLGCLEFFFFFGKHGDEKFNISFVLFVVNL